MPTLIQTLIAAGANVNVATYDNWTPLHVAAFFNASVEDIDALIYAGADVTVKTAHGKTPMELTTNAVIVDLLEQLGGGRATKSARAQ